MAPNERIKKYLDAGTVLGQVTRARAEEIVRELVSAGDIQREHAQEWVDNLVERSRKTSEQILDLVRHEVATQLSKIDAPALETLAGQVSDFLKRSAGAGRAATADMAAQASKGAKAARSAAEKVNPTGGKKKSAPKKSAPKKSAPSSAATKAPAKRAAAKKAAAKTVATKKAPATTKKATKATAATNAPAAKKAQGATKAAPPTGSTPQASN
jgi:polyhydroxyalkanoate synthesis regulator phasin